MEEQSQENYLYKKNWKAFGIYVVVILICLAAFFPAAYTQSSTLIEMYSNVDLNVLQFALLSMVQPLFIAFLFLLAGHFWAQRVGLHSLVYDFFDKEINVKKELMKSLKPAIVSGALYGIIMVSFDLVFRPILPELLQQTVSIPNFFQVIGSVFYGGIVEEIMLRFGFMTILLNIFTFGGRKKRKWIVYLSIVLSALSFALGHYPATSILFEMTPIIWIRMFVLNGLGGLIFGWLYYRYHLEGAMVSHMSVHITVALVNIVLATIGI